MNKAVLIYYWHELFTDFKYLNSMHCDDDAHPRIQNHTRKRLNY